MHHPFIISGQKKEAACLPEFCYKNWLLCVNTSDFEKKLDFNAQKLMGFLEARECCSTRWWCDASSEVFSAKMRLRNYAPSAYD